jgi:hypothetical protein
MFPGLEFMGAVFWFWFWFGVSLFFDRYHGLAASFQSPLG